jgi:hypothetical protein
MAIYTLAQHTNVTQLLHQHVVCRISQQSCWPACWFSGLLCCLLGGLELGLASAACHVTKMLAKCLAVRWGPVLGKAVGPEQTAFLPGRLIGDNITFLQLLPAALRAQYQQQQQGGVGDEAGAGQQQHHPPHCAIAFLDVGKAYDMVCRDFLFALMQATGAGGGMLRWARILLAGTHARACLRHPCQGPHHVAGTDVLQPSQHGKAPISRPT